MRSVFLLLSGIVIGLVGTWLIGRGSEISTPILDTDRSTALANGPAPLASGVTSDHPFTLRSSQSFYTGYPAKNPDNTVNVVVEIPAGTNAKWEVTRDGIMTLELRDGSPRIVNYLPYPGNYGMVPNTSLPKDQGGDGDAIDVLVLGPTLPRGTVVATRLIGVMRYLDKGEQDDKLLAVMDDTPLAGVQSLADLNRVAPAAADIVHLWFTNYKGPGKMVFQGWGEAAEARELLDRAIAAKSNSN